MEKDFILAGAHLRKNRGTSAGLVALMIIASMLLSVSLLVLTDAYPVAQREAERLDSGDGFFRITENMEGIDDELIDQVLADDTVRHYSMRCLNYITGVPYANGTITNNIQICDRSAFAKEMANSEIVTEDASITSDYIYLPYQFYTGGGFEIGDMFSFEIQGNTYDLTVRGFLTTPYFGCNNSGSYEFVVDDDTYERMTSVEGASYCMLVFYELRDGVKNSSFAIRTGNRIIAASPLAAVSNQSIENNINNRTFMSMIIIIAFLIVTAIVLLVVILMLVKTIINYIRENMKTLGILKAIGYTSADIRISLLILFAVLSMASAVIGVICSYLLMPVVSDIVVSQMGIPYKVSFKILPSVAAFIFLIVFTVAITLFALRRIRTIEPIVALRDGTESHSFRKNHVRLDRTSFGLDIALALKTMFFNMWQNVITFFIVVVMVFMCVLGVLMYQNFSVNPKVEMLCFEVCTGLAAFDWETKEDAKEFLEDTPGVTNVRSMINIYMCCGDEDRLLTYVIDNINKLDNKNVCYEGRLPNYDNEVVISGKFAREYDLQIGDTIELTYGDGKFSYLITGFIQTTNNDGKEAFMSEAAASRLVDLTYAPAYYYFDCEENSEESAESVLTRCENEYGDHMISKMNFYKTVNGSLAGFRSIAALMLILLCAVSGVVILLVLFLLIKSLIFNKRKDYGIYKAIGYTSNNLVLQTALSFMPAIISAVAVSSVLSYHLANPFMNIIMGSFGIVKCDFFIPVAGVVAVAVGITVISFLFAILESRRIRKIEAYSMLMSE